MEHLETGYVASTDNVGKEKIVPKEDMFADMSMFSWDGMFKDFAEEQAYRNSSWPALFRQMGTVVGIASLFFMLAALGPIVEMGFTPMVVFITGFRIAVCCFGLVVFCCTRIERLKRFFPVLIVCFVLGIGGYEAAEAVCTYTPNLEFSTPFTLLIIFLLYILFPLNLYYILPAAAFSSAIYVLGLKLYVVPHWSDLLQLSLFFLSANMIGGYLLVRMSRASRIQFGYNQYILQLNDKLRDEVRSKNAAYAQLEELSVMDPLTQIYNRRKFMEVADHEWAVAERYNHPLSMMIVDVDLFKRVNDSYGHAAGDEVLAEVARRMRLEIRETDVVARLGGEEFGVVMPNTSGQSAVHLAERLRSTVASSPIWVGDHAIPVTVSVGVAQHVADEFPSFQSLFNMADEGLYYAKNNGRNQVRMKSKGQS